MSHRKLKATIQLLASDDGGRHSALRSGYRSLLRFENSEEDFGFELTLDDDSLRPGESGSGTISIWAEEGLPELSAGQRFEVKEGNRVVGNGVIDSEIG
jgi:translation elongation factor EF-Tu-like GTPase